MEVDREKLKRLISRLVLPDLSWMSPEAAQKIVDEIIKDLEPD